ncbi:hypothetical protein KDK_69290 [Dictyobacter kobayashii]|uniref:Uncharacterized protein n=1 Tax=Dictyobacter kobayashii TaxID=2014872 RepID=A0A402AVM2_9CHLR|nr:hypothetical protein KDK_69290 [Dictyobacter kobayashii]
MRTPIFIYMSNIYKKSTTQKTHKDAKEDHYKPKLDIQNLMSNHVIEKIEVTTRINNIAQDMAINEK